MTALEAIDEIIEERKANRRFPYVAMFNDIASRCNMNIDDIKKELNALFANKVVDYCHTINQIAFFRYENKQDSCSN